MKKLVSIIIPAYNVENYIDRCLESTLAQTYENIEVIVVDDGSKDSTWSHIKAFMARDERVRGFHRDNAGVSASRNFALSQAAGEYIQFVDADDYLEQKAVETLVKALEENHADWVNCQYQRVDERNNKLENYNFTKGLKHTDTEEAKFDFIKNVLLEYFVGFEVWNKLFKASIIKNNKLHFDENCHLGEDLAFNICYCFYADSIMCIEDRLYNYLIRDDSAMENAKSLEKNFKEHLALIKWIEPQFKKAFNGKLQDCFYQLFYKLMIHGCWNHTVVSSLKIAKEVNDDYYKNNLREALKHKEEILGLFCPEKTKLYYRYGLYINTYLQRDYLRELYLKGYDVYRKLRKRETLEEWRLS